MDFLVSSYLKRLTRASFRRVGLEIHRRSQSPTFSELIVNSLKHHDVRQIIDVGANAGQFGQEMRNAGFTGRIVSFEPTRAAHSRLKVITSHDNKWTVYRQAAIGEKNGTVAVHISGNSVSSSILEMNPSHEEAAPGSAYVGSEVVPMYTLDSVSAIFEGDLERSLLKIDTQGYEWQVLDGASSMLSRVRGILIEMSLIELYRGQRLYADINLRMNELGFTLWGLDRRFSDVQSGRTLQVDGLFFRG